MQLTVRVVFHKKAGHSKVGYLAEELSLSNSSVWRLLVPLLPPIGETDPLPKNYDFPYLD